MDLETCDLALQSHHLLGYWITFLPLKRTKCAHGYEDRCKFIEHVLLARVTDINDTDNFGRPTDSLTLFAKLSSKKKKSLLSRQLEHWNDDSRPILCHHYITEITFIPSPWEVFGCQCTDNLLMGTTQCPLYNDDDVGLKSAA